MCTNRVPILNEKYINLVHTYYGLGLVTRTKWVKYTN